MKVTEKQYGKLPDGTAIRLFRISNDKNLSFDITNYGGIITSLNVPDKNGNVEDVIIGFDNLEGFLQDTSYINALIGRFGNRIGHCKFELDGKEYRLAANSGEHHLHGGINGFHKVVWDAEIIDNPSEAGVKLSYLCRDMEEGYPGNLKVQVNVTLNADNEIKLDYTATTDKATHINLTHHGYYNLTGGKQDIRGHQLKLNARQYTEVDSGLIPTGRILPVEGTDLDYTVRRTIGDRIDHAKGYDLNFVIDKKPDAMVLAAEMLEPVSGRIMEVYTTQPGVQLYTSNHFDGTVTGKQGKKHIQYFAFCLETQHFPDSPNKPQFPSTLLKPGETYHQTTIYKIYAENK